MKIKTKKIADGFICDSCNLDNIELAIEATEKTGVQTCYKCAFNSLKYGMLLEISEIINKYSNYDREETYENEIL